MARSMARIHRRKAVEPIFNKHMDDGNSTLHFHRPYQGGISGDLCSGRTKPCSQVRMVKLRGHHLLCLHGFRGLGYSPEFTANMHAIHSRLIENGCEEITVTDSPDDICAACPNLFEGGCGSSGPEREQYIREKDIKVLRGLKLSPGDKMQAKVLFLKTADEFSEKLDKICLPCRWFESGWCTEGLRKKAICSTGGIE